MDAKGGVRVIPWEAMPGRLTGNARHLTDPAGKLFFATMEERLYEVDVKTLEITGLIKDGNKPKPGQTAEVHPATIDFSASVMHAGKTAEEAHYELTADAKLIRARDDPKAFDVLKHNAAVPCGVRWE